MDPVCLPLCQTRTLPSAFVSKSDMDLLFVWLWFPLAFPCNPKKGSFLVSPQNNSERGPQKGPLRQTKSQSSPEESIDNVKAPRLASQLGGAGAVWCKNMPAVLSFHRLTTVLFLET